MASSIVYPNGTVDVVVPATEKIAIYTTGSAEVYQLIGLPNYPQSFNKIGSVNAEHEVFGAYASGATIRIEAGADKVFYEVGSAPFVQEILDAQYQGAPTAMTTAASITITGILSGIITGTHTAGATAAYTLPTGALTDAGSQFSVGDSIDWSLINLSAAAADTITVTAATGHTIVGNPIVQSAHVSTGGVYGNSSIWRTRKTAADTFVSYRIA